MASKDIVDSPAYLFLRGQNPFDDKDAKDFALVCFSALSNGRFIQMNNDNSSKKKIPPELFFLYDYSGYPKTKCVYSYGIDMHFSQKIFDLMGKFFKTIDTG